MKKMFLLLLCVCLLVSCSGSDTAATVAGKKITKGELEFYLASIKSQLSDTELSADWQTEIEGEKAIDVAKQRALEIAVSDIEYRMVAKARGIELGEEDKKQIDSIKNQVISSHGGEEGYKSFLKENNITDKFIGLMCESMVYYEKLSDKLEKDEPFTEEALSEYYTENKKTIDGDSKKAKHILILTMDPQTGEVFSEDVQNEKKELAESLLERINGGEDFDTLMKEYTEDPGLATAPDGYVFKPGDMVPEFEQAVDSVSEGGITLCKSDYGYHIIKRVPIEYSDMKEQVKEVAMRSKITEMLKDWEKENDIKVEINEEVMKSVK